MSQTHVITMQGGQGNNPYGSTDVYNQQYRDNSATEMINLTTETPLVRYKARPFDWFICSVFGYFCFCCTGVCAMYYAVRANHAVDWDRADDLINDHTKKAKCLTLTSIGIGTAMIVFQIIVIIVWVSTVRNTYY